MDIENIDCFVTQFSVTMKQIAFCGQMNIPHQRVLIVFHHKTYLQLM